MVSCGQLSWLLVVGCLWCRVACAAGLGKIFYTCALINKQLKYLAQSSALVKKMHSFFTARWPRWHKTVHVLAYALDTSYQSHTLSHFEYQQCSTVLKRIRPDTWTQAVVELKEFKRNTELFDATVWSVVDNCHGYLWWDAFGAELPVLQVWARSSTLARSSTNN